MAFNLLISIQAQADTITAINYYGAINANIVDRFLTELLNAYRKILENPQYYSYISSKPADKLRDIKLKVFPYVIVYQVQEENVIIMAVFNTYKKPIL